MSKYKKLTVLLKRTQYVEVEVSEECGWDLPQSFQGLHEFCNEVKDRPSILVEEDTKWETEDGIQVEEFGVEEA